MIVARPESHHYPLRTGFIFYFLFFFFSKNPSFKIAMSGQAGIRWACRQRARVGLWSSSEVYLLVNRF